MVTGSLCHDFPQSTGRPGGIVGILTIFKGCVNWTVLADVAFEGFPESGQMSVGIAAREVPLISRDRFPGRRSAPL